MKRIAIVSFCKQKTLLFDVEFSLHELVLLSLKLNLLLLRLKRRGDAELD